MKKRRTFADDYRIDEVGDLCAADFRIADTKIPQRRRNPLNIYPKWYLRLKYGEVDRDLFLHDPKNFEE